MACGGQSTGDATTGAAGEESSGGDGGAEAAGAAGEAGADTADAGRGGTGAGGATAMGGMGGSAPAFCQPDPSPLKRLTAWEYARTVPALTGTPTSVPLPQDVQYFGPFSVAGTMTALTLEALLLEAEGQGTALGAVWSQTCAGEQPEPCARTFVTDFVRRAFRRPLSEAETQRYESLFAAGFSGPDPSSGVSLAVTAALLSPNFLYKLWFGNPSEAGDATLTEHEVASKLSFFLSGAAPDAELGRAADSGNLGGTAAIEAQARRLIEGPRFTELAQHIYAQWLGLDNLPHPDLSPMIAESMRTETLLFIAHVFDAGQRSLSSLLTAPVGFIDANLAPIYAVPNTASGFTQTELDGAQRAGVLTLTGTLANYRDPSQRGLLVRERLLCQPVPPPPPDVNKAVTIEPDQTRREAWEQATSQPACAGCHDLFDPIGFGFEHFDELGAYRTTDNGRPIDASGHIASTGLANQNFVGAVELAHRLAESSEVQRCTVQQWIVYLNQRPFEESDICLLEQGAAALESNSGDLGAMLVALAGSSEFRRRAASPSRMAPEPGAFDATVTTLPERRLLILDQNLQELEVLRARLSETDLLILDVHAEAVRELERRSAEL